MGWLEGWSYRRPITVTAGSNGMPANYQVKIIIDTASLISAGKMRSDGGDIRFTKSDGVTLLSYWIESGINTTSTIIWVNDPDALSASASHIIYMYYGNPSATSQSSGGNTFDDFDDFLTNTLANYVQIDSGWSIDTTPPGYLKSPSTGQGFIAKSKSLSRAYAVRARVYVSSADAGVGFIWGTAGGSGSSVNGYIANYCPIAAYSRLRRYVSGSYTVLAGLPALSSGWYVVELRVASSAIIVIRDTTQDANVTDTTFSTLSGVGFRQKTASTYAVDWWALRKYVDPEPSTTIGAEEYLLIISDSGSGVDRVNMTHEARDSGAGSEVLSLSASIPVAESGSGAEAVNMTKGALDAGSGSELLTLSASIPVGDAGAGVEAVDMVKEALDSGIGYDYFTGGLGKYVDDSGAGVEYVDMSKEALDAGSGVESVDMAHEALDSGSGVDAVISPQYNPLTDSGAGVDAVISPQYNPLTDSGAGVDAALIQVPQSDAGAGVEAVNMSKEALDIGAGVEAVNMAHEARDSGAGVDAVNMVHEALDYGAGVEAVNMAHEARDAGAGFDASTVTGIIPAFDSGSGVDIVTQMIKAIIDSGRGVEAVYISASVVAYDSGIGTDIIGIVAQISVEDFGKGVEFADWFLSMYGMVLIDNDDVGYHSIPYKDWKQKNIPVQVHRRSVSDKVYIDSDEIGDVVVEWEDRVSDVIPGERTLIVTGVVELYD